MEKRRYDAFMSYSHAADGQLAPAVQQALERFAKPWYRRRALHVFRDRTGLAINEGLWPSIESAIKSSRTFILMASPQSAGSVWVEREVKCRIADNGGVLVVVTGGTIVWSDRHNDFDWTLTDCLPSALRGHFNSQPLYLDLTWAKRDEHFSPTHPRFLDGIAELAAALHGVPKDDIASEAVRQHKRTLRIAWTAVVSLVVLLAASVVATVVALEQRSSAIVNAERAHEKTLEADEERKRAIEQSKEAQTAREAADRAAVDANVQRAEAQKQRDAAVTSAAEAKRQRDAAREAEAAALESAEEARLQRDIAIAHSEVARRAIAAATHTRHEANAHDQQQGQLQAVGVDELADLARFAFTRLAYPAFDQGNLDENVTGVIVEAVKAASASQQRKLMLIGHIGVFCVSREEPPRLAPPDLPISKCKFWPGTPEYMLALGHRLADTLRNVIRRANVTTVEVTAISRGDLDPVVAYPEKGTAADWNKAARMNNRIDMAWN